MLNVAKGFRREPTAGEAVLWDALRGRRLGGRKFRRQQPIGPFVLDFYCPSERLAVEVDGGVHENPEQSRLDAERQRLIESLGIRFVRLRDSVVRQELNAAPAISSNFENTSGARSPSPLVGEGRPKAGVRVHGRRQLSIPRSTSTKPRRPPVTDNHRPGDQR
ncbi:MAG: endonuclease domain-containing protein [Dehalococcoidia bacterium]|nr:MAG: endonuclease domain-containing protein [Dehalococcoidia bacterium]